ncbi:MAG: hypothetical protein HQK84_08180 [Nitrospinae bacterium]|nr:hypothetical protein [Nitrospinota bacterium]
MVLTQSCSEKPTVKNYYEEEVNYVFSKFIDKNDKFIFKLALNQPLRISQKQMDAIMLSLKYVPEESFFDLSSNNVAESVFNKDTILKVAPQFRKKLQDLAPEEKIVFAVIGTQGRTSGEVFVLGNGMHWRFSHIKGNPYIKSQKNITDWIAPWTNEDENFRLVLQKGQWFHATREQMPRAGNRNWIILPVKNKRLTKKDDVVNDYIVRRALLENPETSRRILLNTLMMLEKELEGGVISYGEYKKRRKDVLDSM